MTEQNKPKKGLWSDMSTEDKPLAPAIKFEVNITQKAIFLKNDPIEKQSKDDPESVYYVFEVEQDKAQKVIMTSAWSLLRELKKLSPLAGKQVEITKRLIKGKQNFEVKEVK